MIPWHKRFQRYATIKTENGQTATLQGFLGGTEKKPRFVFYATGPFTADKDAFGILRAGTVNRLCVKGVWYSVSYVLGIVGGETPTLEESIRLLGRVILEGEPTGEIENGGVADNTGKVSSKDQILDVLKSSPDGLTARQIMGKVECGRQWVFFCLGALIRAGEVQKLGTIYKAA